ncbi:hypothetical protein B566_EDAN018647, partial [Ephemera danica]
MKLATIGSQAEHDAITNYIQGAGVKLQITRQRQYVIQCCSGHWSCNAAGSSGRLRTVTAQKSFFNVGINRINTVERLRVIRRRQFIIQCCSGYWSCYAGPDGRLRTVTPSKAIEASTEPINAAVTTTTGQIILSSTTFNPNVPTNLTLVEISTINSASSSTTSVATTAQPSAITTSNTASTTTGVISSSTSASTNTQPITSTSATTSITTNASTTTQSIASSSTTTSTSTGTTTTTSTSTATGTTTTTEPVTSTSTATGTST